MTADTPAWMRTCVRAATVVLISLPSMFAAGQDTVPAAPDSTVGAPDSTMAQADSVGIADAAGTMALLRPVGRGDSVRAFNSRRLAAVIPARLFAFEFTDLLKDQPASFLFDLGSHGWPHGWSPLGIAPQHVGLTWDGIALQDLFTGRPQYEILPLAASAEPIAEQGARARPMTIAVNTRSVETSGAPLTEFRYQASNKGLQKVTVLHTQNRRIAIAGPGVLNVALWYRGEGAAGEYPGSRLRRGRQIQGRILYIKPSWSLELNETHTRQPLGAHGGVVQAGSDFNSIYQRLGATVRNESAKRTTIRNDIFATFRFGPKSWRGAQSSVQLGLSGQSLEYRRPGDTLEVRSRRSFLSVRQDIIGRGHRLLVELHGSIDETTPRADSLAPGGTLDRRLLATATEQLNIGRSQLTATAGAETRHDGTGLVGSFGISLPFGPAAFSIEASQSPQPVAAIDRSGFGAFLRPRADTSVGSIRVLRSDITVRAGPFDAALTGAAALHESWRDYFATSTDDSVAVRLGDGALRTATLTFDLGFRRHAERGIYAYGGPTLFRDFGSDDTADIRRFLSSQPEFYAVGRIGMRYLLFRGDFDLDLSVRGRFWSQFRGRELHAPTGLLVLSRSDGILVESSAAVDVIVTAGVRTATLFLSYENFLSGTQAIPGNLIVPVYPLPERMLRFGVFWPISN